MTGRSHSEPSEELLARWRRCSPETILNVLSLRHIIAPELEQDAPNALCISCPVLYLIWAMDDPKIFKIGITKNLYRRLWEYTQLHAFGRLVLFAVAHPADVRYAERVILEKFGHKKVYGREWLKLSKKDLSWIYTYGAFEFVGVRVSNIVNRFKQEYKGS